MVRLSVGLILVLTLGAWQPAQAAMGRPAPKPYKPAPVTKPEVKKDEKGVHGHGHAQCQPQPDKPCPH